MLLFGPWTDPIPKLQSLTSRKLAMNAVTNTGVELIVRSGGWRRRLFTFALIGASIVVTFLLVTTFYTGETFIDRLGKAYAAVWHPTTQRPFTFIMRDNPWLLIIPAVAITLSVWLLTPLTNWWRASAMYLALGIGVVLGHVFR